MYIYIMKLHYWSIFSLITALLVIYVGYTTLQKEPLDENISRLLMGLGIVIILYHGNLLTKNRM